MVVTIDCRDTINCKFTIVLCNRAHGLLFGIKYALKTLKYRLFSTTGSEEGPEG